MAAVRKTLLLLAGLAGTCTAAAQTSPQPGSENIIPQLDDRSAQHGSAVARDSGPAGSRRTPGSQCPAGYLCGQNETGGIWLYSDLGASTPDPENPGILWTRRVTSEQFPPPGVAPLTEPIATLSWHGAYIDDAGNGRTKAHHFRIEFYNDDGTGKPDCAHPAASWSVVPDVAEVVDTVDLGGATPADEYEFTVVLPAVVSLPSGHFSITSDNVVPNCYHLLAPAANSVNPEGNNLTWRWYEQPTPCNFYPVTGTTVDIHYCLGRVALGACCSDCGGAGGCSDSNEVLCRLQGGRFQAGVACSAMSPPCGQATGACCQDDGSCTLTTCAECRPATQACCLPDHSCDETIPTDCIQRAGTLRGSGSTCATVSCNYCLGDLNCDGVINFKDINPFVVYLSDRSAWQRLFPTCNPRHGDLNCDGTYYSFKDINSFVVLLSSTTLPIHCPLLCPPRPAPRDQGPSWGGVGSTCDPNTPAYGCCTVVVPPGANREDEASNCTTDHYDGGCNSTPPVFRAIGPLPYTIYGQSGTLDGLRDTDWYEYTSDTAQVFTASVRAEFEPVLSVLHAGTTDLCTDAWLTGEPVTGPRCTDVRLVTRCLPPGRYWIVVAPAALSGVSCGADYQLTVESSPCESCAITCIPTSLDDAPCNDDPNHPDEYPGCSGDPNNPNQFEPIPYTVDTPSVVCGTVWARGGDRDVDWCSLVLTERTTVSWQVDTEIPIRATLLFTDPGGGIYGPPRCTQYYPWGPTLYTPCEHGVWSHPEIVYEPGTYWFVVEPQDGNGPIVDGYPCGFDNDYRIELVVGKKPASPCGTDLAPNLTEAEPGCGPGYLDNYNSGCDRNPAGPRLPIVVDPVGGLTHDYCATSGTWLEDPNDPATLTKDYDWYEFTLSGQQSRGFSIYCYAEFPVTVEVWPNNCTTEPGPIEGVQIPLLYNSNVLVAQCYSPGTYWLRVYPTGTSVACGSQYYLALYGPSACTACAIDCTGTIDADDLCGAPDTNAGCDGSPVDPSHFLTFAPGNTYCGRSYAQRVGGVGYYDPDWFQLHLDETTNLRLRVRAEFPSHVALYRNCAEYGGNAPPLGFRNIFAACAGPTAYTDLDIPALPAGDYVGVIYPVDRLGELLTNYYPCGHFNRYQMEVATY